MCGTSNFGRSKGSSGGIPASDIPVGICSLNCCRILTRNSSIGVSRSGPAEMQQLVARNIKNENFILSQSELKLTALPTSNLNGEQEKLSPHFLQ